MASKAKGCASQLNMSWSAITNCFANDQGKQLLKQASDHFNATHPGRTGIPLIEVNGEYQKNRNCWALLGAVCKTGVKASACSGGVLGHIKKCGGIDSAQIVV